MIYNLPRRRRRVQIDASACLTFSAAETFSLSVSNPGWDGTMQYATDEQNWSTWDGSEVSGTKIYVRGVGNTKVTGSSNSTKKWTITGSGVSCDGNVETLLDHATAKAGGHPTMAESCYAYLFANCSALISSPTLPAVTLTKWCYSGMFSGCTSLAVAPELPATTLADSCYSVMFNSCTSMRTPPELPATALVDNCYFGMFYGDSNLTTLPKLQADYIRSYSYYEMFYGCSNIKLSEKQDSTYTQAYRIPFDESESGSVVSSTNSMGDMFAGTGGSFTGTPKINTTYYLHKDCGIVS